jgi:hypothetical protein
MAASIAGAAARIKRADDPLGVLGRGAVGRVCEELGHDWRERELDPATTVALFVQQVLHGNCPCSEVRHLPAARRAGAGSGADFTASAYCQARSRLPLAAYQALLTRVCDAALPATRQAEHLWLGRHRVFHVDGSSFSMPDTPELRQAFGVPSGTAEGCAFPVAHLLVLFSASTGLLLDAWAGPLRTGDAAQTPEAHLHLSPGDVVIGDDAFGTYAHLASLSAAGLHGLFPTHHVRIVDFTPGRPHTTDGKDAVAGLPRSRWVRSLGVDDQLVEYFKPKQRSRWMTQAQWDALPASIVVRELRRTAAMPGGGRVTLTMATTLTDPAAYPAAALLELRLRRWDVETNLGHLKTTMKMDVLRCKTEAGVRKELAVFCLVYNLVRVTVLEAARRQEVAVSRVSFADALRWLRHARPGEPMPELMPVPHRPGRAEPRCRKRRPKQFPVMKKPRRVLREMLKNRVKNA